MFFPEGVKSGQGFPYRPGLWTAPYFIPFHFAKAAANRLTNAEFDPVAKIPEFKVCAVTIEKAA